MESLKIGARGSPLSLAQTGRVGEALKQHFPQLQIEIIPIKTRGDDPSRKPTGPMGIKGLFVKEIEEALMSRAVDLAVHSAKDLPALLPKGLALGAVPLRENPFDALIHLGTGGLGELPEGAKIGTSSLRRKSQLLAFRQDFVISPLRGNVDTRIGRVKEGAFDATILACSGLLRLKGSEYPINPIEPNILLPAPGQGLLALEYREGDNKVRDLIAILDHGPSALALASERSFMLKIGAGCQTPAAAWGRIIENKFHMDALIADLDGSLILRSQGITEELSLEAVTKLGEAIALELLSQGGAELIVKAEKESY
jgi:hydroxymethylbilane synthase